MDIFFKSFLIEPKQLYEKTIKQLLSGECVINKYEIKEALLLMDQNQTEKYADKSKIFTQDKIINKNFDSVVDNPDVMLYCLQNTLKEVGVQMIYTDEGQAQSSSWMNVQNLTYFDSTENNVLSISIPEQEQEELTFDHLQNNSGAREEFLMDFKIQLASTLKISIDNIRIYGIRKGSIKVLFDVYDEDLLSQGLLNRKLVIKCELSVQKLIKSCKLDGKDFSPEYNMTWGNDHNEIDWRGGMVYYLPRGWKGYALNVLNKYGKDNSWLGMENEQGEWPVFYHGYGQNIVKVEQFQQGVKNIVNEGLSVGGRQLYEKDKSLNDKGIVGKGIYLSNHIEVAEEFAGAHELNGEQYKLVFQVRANPDAVKQIKRKSDIHPKNPEWDNDYFVVNESINIRPYRILLKKIQKN